MEIQCPKCGETCAIDFEPEVGQHIVCPFCNTKFSYGETEEAAPRTVMAVCPYCGFGESVGEVFVGQVGQCSQCGRDFTIIANDKGIPFSKSCDTTQRASATSGACDSHSSIRKALLWLISAIIGAAIIVWAMYGFENPQYLLFLANQEWVQEKLEPYDYVDASCIIGGLDSICPVFSFKYYTGKELCVRWCRDTDRFEVLEGTVPQHWSHEFMKTMFVRIMKKDKYLWANRENLLKVGHRYVKKPK